MKIRILSGLLCLFLIATTPQSFATGLDPKVWKAIKITVLDTGLTTPPKAIKTVNPRFPEAVRRQPHYLLTINFTVDAEGKVRDLYPVGTQDQLFVNAARDAVFQWQFEPATKDGVAIASHVQMVIPFKTVSKEVSPERFSQ
jgi:TonB family protein